MESQLEQSQYFSLQTLFSIQSEFVAVYGVVFLLMLVALFFLYPEIKLILNVYNTKKIFKQLGKQQLKNVAIQLNLDETIYIDHLILTPAGIFILNVLKYNGIIFAGDNVEQWTQLLNKKSYKFPNPLRDLEVCESALRGVVTDCNIFGHIAFESNCQFPKGKPGKVSLLHEMLDELDFLKGDIDIHLIEKWNELKNSDQCTFNIKHNDLSILVKDEQKSIRNVVGIFFLVSSLLLLIYHVNEFKFLENLFI